MSENEKALMAQQVIVRLPDILNVSLDLIRTFADYIQAMYRSDSKAAEKAVRKLRIGQEKAENIRQELEQIASILPKPVLDAILEAAET